MAGDDFQRSNIAVQHLGRAVCAIFMVDPVESVSSNALFVPRVRAGIDLRFEGKSAVKAGVEDGELRDVGKKLGREINSLQSRPVVKRRNGGNVGDRLAYCGGHNG